ncbi:MAG: SRPBCC family protein [Thermaceae bacterium]|nr:SRPBCC family protein [Thermaceae bacterium]
MERTLQSVWVFPTTLGAVWAVLADIQGWPLWWPWVQEVQTVEPGKACGVGAVYRLGGEMQLRVCEVRAPELLEVYTDTILARWILYNDEGYTFVNLSVWGCHEPQITFAQAMLAGAKGLAQCLGIELAQAGSWSTPTDDLFFS